MLALPMCLLAKKVSSLTSDAELRSKPDNGASIVSTVPAGEIVTILEPDLPDFWVKVQAPDGSIGYVDSGALDFPSGREAEEEPNMTATTTSDAINGIPVLKDDDGNLMCVVTQRTPVYYRKDRSNPNGEALSAGTTLSVKGINKAANQVEVWLNGNIVYVDLSDVDFDSRNFPEPEDPAAAVEPVSQKAIPRDGAYKVIRKGLRVFVGKPHSRDIRENIYQEGDVLSGVKYLNKEWLEITFEGGPAFVEPQYLHKMRLYELVRQYGEDDPIVQEEKELIAQAPGFSVFNGWKAGLFGVWLVIAATIALGVMTCFISLKDDDSIAPKSIVRYGQMLALISVLEIWYFLTLGIDQAAWFLGRSAGEYWWTNFLILIAITAVQGFGIFKYVESVQESRGFFFSQKWTFGGILISLILYAIFRLTAMNEEVPSDVVAPVLVICALLGQIPQILALLISFIRSRTRRAGSPSIYGILVTYWIALIGLICVAALSVGLLIAMALCVILLYGLIRQIPSMADQMVKDVFNDTSRNAEYGVLFDRLEQQVINGVMNSKRAQELKQQLEEKKNKGERCPKNLNF